MDDRDGLLPHGVAALIRAEGWQRVHWAPANRLAGAPTGKGTGSTGDADIRDVMTELPKRATHRWTGYDYANVGAYYLTICTQDRLHRFGHIADGVLHPTPIGELARQCWDAIPQHMPHVDIGEFVVMPNHVHGIVVIRERLVDVRGARWMVAWVWMA